MTSKQSAFSLSAGARERRLTIQVVAAGTVTWAIAFAAAWMLWPAGPLVPPADRVSYALQLGAAPAIVTLLMTCACLRLFDTPRAEDPRLGAESERFKINQRVLTNTVEQSLIFVPLVLALSVRLPPGQLKLLPIAVSVWCAGRLMFWVGYHKGPSWRAPGFDWTFNTTCLLAGWFVYTLA
jgi:hypothetical protein